MPSSNLIVAPTILWLVHSAEPHATVLDVGPGWGKFAVLLREYLNEPPALIDAIEVHAPYVADHRLESLYDRVFVGDALDVDADGFAGYDVVLLSDVIEHMDKVRAVDMLGRIRGWVVICTPVEWFDTGPGLPPSEAHVSHWTLSDFEATGRLDDWKIVEGGLVVRLGPLPL